MQTLKYEVRFLTPAFLGNAEQSGQWRTPPFKALLRQWWRVVWAAKHEFQEDLEAMRRDEGLLFGNAWLKRDEDGRKVADYRKSQVRMRLSRWTAGRETKEKWGVQDIHPSGWKVRHPEVPQPIGPLLYLGYGPLEVSKLRRSGRQEYATTLKQNAVIQAGETAILSIAAPDRDIADIRSALVLIDAYGTAGGRSRNGWGSISLAPANGLSACDFDLAATSRPWRDALALDWPHAIGQDDTGLLVWQTVQSYGDWKTLMRDLAMIKIGLRTHFSFSLNERAGDQPIIRRGVPRGISHRYPQHRHWLSYPVTNHPVKSGHRSGRWAGEARLPNNLRYKVLRDARDPNRLLGVIFHVPCKPPREFKPDSPTIERVWQRVHRFMDEFRDVQLQRLVR